VSFSLLVLRNFRRGGLRTPLTAIAVAVAVVAFIMLRTVVDAWELGAQYAAIDRLTTRHRVSYGRPLPRRYVDDIAARVPAVRAITHCDWFGARWAGNPALFFANLACADNAFEVYPEVIVEPASLARWKQQKQGAIVGDLLAKQLGVSVGDRMTLQGSLYPGDWELEVVGLYTAPPKSAVDRASLFFRWDYKNERMPEEQRDQVDWIFTRVDDPARGPATSRTIDALFAEREIRTTTMTERAANLSLLGSVSALLKAIDVMSLLVLGIIVLMLGNALAMNVRERAAEHAVMRALGFLPSHVRWMVAGEALLVSCAGCGLGVCLSFPLVQVGLGGWLEENMGQFFPAFRISAATLLAVFVLAFVLALTAVQLPLWRAGSVRPSEALRSVA
jgi:putative ABC transport system permease protein